MHIRTFALLALATALIGLCHLSILPPFEGFDEPAHYSSMGQIADTGTLPIYGRSGLSKEIIDYRLHGPAPYTTFAPPFTGNHGMTYQEFFAKAGAIDNYIKLYRQSSSYQPYASGSEINWEAQHPPLYYLLLAPVMKAAESFSLVDRLFILRLVSFALAYAGLGIGLYGSLTYGTTPSTRSFVIAAFLLYPLIVPMFFPEFARLGNDSLCLPFIGILWALVLRWLRQEEGILSPVLIGMVLGFGLLTKALFIPVSGGLILFLAFRLWRNRNDVRLVSYRFKSLVLMGISAFLLGGWWYVLRIIHDGSAVGYEYLELAKGGGLLTLLHRRFTPAVFLQGIAGLFASWQWGGTWSLVRIDDWLRIPLLILTVWLVVEYLREARKHPLTNIIWLPLWLCLPFLGCLIYHVLIMIALRGAGATPGWYFHIMAPAVAFAFAHGLARIASRPYGRHILIAFLIYAIAFIAMAFWAQAAMFAGCAGKAVTKYYAFAGQYFCLDNAGEVITHIQTWGWPVAGLIAFAIGLLCFMGTIATMRFRQDRHQP